LHSYWLFWIGVAADPDRDPMPVTLFVDRIAKSVTSKELEDLFQSFHPSRVILASHRSGTPLGFAFVLFLNEEDASHALQHLQGAMLAGRSITISRTITPMRHSGLEN
jgi:RNA recognition motif-containing protein